MTVSTTRLWRPMGRCLPTAFGVALLVLSIAPAQAQTITGTVLDGGTGAPIPAAVITLLTEPGDVTTRVEADSLGVFSATAPRAGSYYLRAERIGYRAVTEGIFDLGAGGTMEVQINLLTQPVELEGVEATVTAERAIERRQREYLEWQGFYDRKKMGFGSFITPEEIEEKPPFRARDLFKMIPGVNTGNVTGTPGTDGIVTMKCAPPRGLGAAGQIQVGSVRAGGFAVFVNGIRVYQGREWDMRSDVAMADIAAVEVYPRLATLPIEYSGFGVCGAILIWTR